MSLRDGPLEPGAEIPPPGILNPFSVPGCDPPPLVVATAPVLAEPPAFERPDAGARTYELYESASAGTRCGVIGVPTPNRAVAARTICSVTLWATSAAAATS